MSILCIFSSFKFNKDRRARKIIVLDRMQIIGVGREGCTEKMISRECSIQLPAAETPAPASFNASAPARELETSSN